MPQPLSFMLLKDEGQAEALDLGNSFTDMTRAGVKVWPANQVALLVRGDETGVAVLQIGSVSRSRQRLATGWHRLRYVRRRQFGPPLGLEALVASLPPRFRRTVETRASSGGVLTEKSAAAVVDAIQRLAPADGRELRRLLGEGTPTRLLLRGSGLQAAAQEADAVRLAIDIAGIPRKALRDVRPDGESSFLEQLEYVRASEDTTIAYDGMRFLDFDRIESPSGTVTFANGIERLTVVNVNRQPLERTTGADLIYINETVPSFVLVQYKTMRREGNPSKLVYRPDKQLEDELDRMRKIKPGADDGSPANFRLNSATCFLKLCKPVVRLDRGQDLVSGMYLPLDYYDVLAASPDARGPRGGVALSYDTVRRHVSNDLFVALVRGGWVGSRGSTTKKLTKLVLAGLAADRSVTIAASSRSADFDYTDR